MDLCVSKSLWFDAEAFENRRLLAEVSGKFAREFGSPSDAYVPFLARKLIGDLGDSLEGNRPKTLRRLIGCSGKLLYACLTAGIRPVRVAVEDLRVKGSTQLGASALEVALAKSDLQPNQRYWLHTVVSTEKSSDARGKVREREVKAAFTVEKMSVGFGRDGWVCLELLSYLQKYTMHRPRTTALLAMLHSRSIIWCREWHLKDVDFVKFQASTIAVALRANKGESQLEEELAGRLVGASIVQTMSDQQFDEEVVPSVVRNYLMSPWSFLAPLFLLLERPRRRLWVSRGMAGHGLLGTNDGSLRGEVWMNWAIAKYQQVLSHSPIHIPLSHLPVRWTRMAWHMFMTPYAELPVVKSKEYFT